MNIVEEIFRHADPSAVSIISGDRHLTFAALRDLTNKAAATLGITPSQRIGLHCPNGVAHIIWSLAVLKCGGVLVPIAPELSVFERDTQLATTGLDAILCADECSWHMEMPSSRDISLEDLGSATLLSGWDKSPLDFNESDLAALNPALIRFSSGTSGKRKGVVLSHQTLYDRVRASNSHLSFGPGDRIIWILPMAHHFAVSIILYLLHGATTVLEDSHLGADVYAALVRHQGTALYASPFHYALLASCAEAAPVPSLRRAISTAAPLPTETSIRFREHFGIPLQQALGIIECGLPLLNDLWPLDKPGSVGRSQSGYEFSLRDPLGAEMPVETEGELFLRGPGFVDAYLSPWTPRKDILQEGWFHTGDFAKADKDGAVTLCGRSSSVINVGGMKCFPEEVEAVLNAHPSVRESRVISMNHPTFGNVPTAEIIPVADKPKILELSHWCRGRLSSYKRPVKFSFVDSIPKTPSGKIQRTSHS